MAFTGLGLKKDNPLPPGEGGGFVLPGYKTYIVGAVMQLIGVYLIKLHVPGDIADWVRANVPSLLMILAGSGFQTVRAALAKAHDAVIAILKKG